MVANQWLERLNASIAAERSARERAALMLALTAPPDTTAAAAAAPPPPAAEAPPPSPLGGPTFGAVSKYADLGIELSAKFTMKVNQLTNLRCTAADLVNPVSGCRGGFPTPALDQQFDVRAGGIVSNRVHVNVDYGSNREFSASNNINVYYEGLEDEILRRVDVGNVTFQPPPSRFISAAIPANSFGVQAEAQLGAFDFHAIVAQQKGSALQTKTFTIGQTTTEPINTEKRDLDFETGRFFFVHDPRLIPGYPNIDILNLSVAALPVPLRVAQVRVYRLRAQSGQVGSNANLGGIQAVAVRQDSPQRVGPFSWDLLVEGSDYYLDPSGEWFALSSRVTNEDYLAVSYITQTGDTVGTFPAVNGKGDTLELIYEPRRGSEVPTFFYEMRNVYNLGGSEINRSSLTLAIKLNESERPLDGSGTYLSRFGLALPTDPSTVDQFNRVFPRARDPNNGLPLHNLFLIFPTLRPFADSTKLQPAERADSMYQTPIYLLGSQGPPPRFRMQLHYEATGASDRSQLFLGAIQIRENSEKIFVGNTQLIPNVDYHIDYSTGIVLFTNPDSLFPGPASVRAQFEENLSFDAAPKSILGFSTTYTLGSTGHLNAIGLVQREQSVYTRPQLGFEPRSTFIGGLNGDLQFRADWLTHALNSLPLIETTVPSTLTMTGELAMSRPNPNSAGQAYVEEFESTASKSINLVENAFQLGSRPSSGRGLPVVDLGASGGFDMTRAVMMNWQSVISSGNQALEFTPQSIDSSIVLFGTTTEKEPVLWLTLQPDTVGGVPDPKTGAPRWNVPHVPGPRWGSITQALDRSGLGVDLSREEYLEFWVLEDADRKAKQDGAVLVFDFGTVFEDAVASAPDSFFVNGSDTTFTGRQYIGVGRLDSEKDTLTNVFNASTGDNGIWGDVVPSIVNGTSGETVSNLALCDFTDVGRLPVFPLGYVGSRCTRHNGAGDTEDLNGDNRLDIDVGTTQEDLVRYVFPIGSDKYFVRNGSTLTTNGGRTVTWRLYRIPFRTDTLQIGQPNIRQIRSLRMTMVAPDRGDPGDRISITLARMSLVGAPWLKRSNTPIAGIAGSLGQSHGEVVASVVTTENSDLGYTPPPGVINESDRVGTLFQIGGSQQINEHSLRVLASDLRVGERAEAFKQFTDEADKNFLNYRQLRVWARGRGPGWEDGDLQFYIKVGRDENNFYMYRAPARTTSWEPEVVIQIDRWLALRTKVEQAWLSGAPPSGAAECGGDSTAYVACDGPYLVQVHDPGIAPPNLARVSEVAVGMLRVDQHVFIGQAELWVDDIRLSDVVDTPGYASAFDAHLTAADVVDVAASVTTKDARFQQLNENPSYSTDAGATFGTTLHVEKFLPLSWGVSIPVSVQYTHNNSDPYYLNQSDVLAGALDGLRRPVGSATSYQVAFRRTKRGDTFLEHVLLDPVSVTALKQKTEAVTQLSTSDATNQQMTLGYSQVPGDVSVRAAPGFLVSLVDALPGFVRNSAFAKGLRTSQLRLNPYQINWHSVLTDTRTTRFAYRVPVALASDAQITPLQSLVHTWHNDGGLDLRPFHSLSAQATYASTRDLQDYGDSSTIGRLLAGQRRSLAGMDVGFERQRNVSTAISVQPVFNRWWTPRLSFNTSFGLSRDPNASNPVRLGSDSSGAFSLPETFVNSRSRSLGSTVDLAQLTKSLFKPSTVVVGLLGRVQPTDVSYTRELHSSFDRARFTPSLRYQFAQGGLDEFRAQGGDLATAAGTSAGWTISGGADLPLGLRGRFNYRDQQANNWTLRGGDQIEIDQRTREWPSGNVSWIYTPRLPGVRNFISNVSAQAGYRRQTTTSFQPALGTTGGQTPGDSAHGVLTQSEATSINPSLTVTWMHGIITQLQYTHGRNDQVTSGNVTRSDHDEWGGTLNFSFKPPRSLVRLASAIRTAVTLNSQDLNTCLIRAGSDTCTAISESKRQSADVRMDTPFSPTVSGSMSFSYVLTEQLATSAKLRQITFTVSGTLRFSEGRIQ